MTGNFKFFEKLNPHHEDIKMADGRRIDVKGQGSGHLSTSTVKIRLKNVLYTPGLKCNLISISKITDAGFDIHFKKGSCQIVQNGEIIMEGKRSGNLYRLDLAEKNEMCSRSQTWEITVIVNYGNRFSSHFYSNSEK
jgi:hypothetical protein